MKIDYTESLTSPIYLEALAIRRRVFMEEQGVSEALEIEGEENCLHFVLSDESGPLATCRLFKLSPQQVKLQRMAVLKEARNRHFGRQLMEAAEQTATKQGYTFVILGAQLTALGFYEKLGYTPFGAEFLDADIPHRMMEKKLCP